MIADNFLFAGARRITHPDAHQESVELRFGQRIRPVMLDRILRREHEKRFRQRVRVVVDGDLRFVHRLQQRRLRFRRRAVDLVGHDDIREDRPGLEFEFLRHGIEHADADHVARQHVGSELDALERALEGPRDRLRESGLPNAGDVFDQQMPARQQRGQRELDHVFLALHDAPDRALQVRKARADGSTDVGGCLQFPKPSATKSAIRGRLAQWLERSPHTGEVQGSSPWSPTMPALILALTRWLPVTRFRTSVLKSSTLAAQRVR